MQPINQDKHPEITQDIKTKITGLTNKVSSISDLKIFDYQYESTVKKRRNKMIHLTPKKKKRK